MRKLYEVHGSLLLGYLTNFLDGDRHAAEDIVQETLLRAWCHPEARTADGDWTRAWLLTVARRIAIDQIRATRSRPSHCSDSLLNERPDGVDEIERLVDNREIWAAVAELPPRQRSALIEVYFRGRSVLEAAEVLGVPVGTIKSRTFYAVCTLQKTLARRGFLMPPRSGLPPR